MIDFSTKKGIFSDPKLQAAFHENGYVIVPFISTEQIEELFGVYKSCYPEGVDGFFSTMFTNNAEKRQFVNTSISDICEKQIEALFSNYKVVFSIFIVKAPGKNSQLVIHQDMTLVDEDVYSGINIWCPLVDLTETNGAIEILPKSHRFYKTYRGSSLPNIYENVKEEVQSLMQPCFLKAGEAIIFDQSIIHNSPPNLAHAERPSINTFVTHKEAKIRICYWDKENHSNEVEIFEQEDTFLENLEEFGSTIIGQPSRGKSLGLFPYDFPKLTVEQLERELDVKIAQESVSSKDEPKQSWIKRIFSTRTA